MGESLITNNCIGVGLLEDLRTRYDTPTIALQILPEEFPKFCANLRHYMECEITEYKDFSEEHEQQAKRMFGNIPTFPCGLCDDIVIYFQHYKTFEEAIEKWNRRKARLDYNHLGFMFYLNSEKYSFWAEEFMKLKLKHSVVFTQGFDVEVEHCRVDLPNGKEFLGRAPGGKRYFEQNFNREKFLRGVHE